MTRYERKQQELRDAKRLESHAAPSRRIRDCRAGNRTRTDGLLPFTVFCAFDDDVPENRGGPFSDRHARATRATRERRKRRKMSDYAEQAGDATKAVRDLADFVYSQSTDPSSGVDTREMKKMMDHLLGLFNFVEASKKLHIHKSHRNGRSGFFRGPLAGTSRGARMARRARE